MVSTKKSVSKKPSPKKSVSKKPFTKKSVSKKPFTKKSVSASIDPYTDYDPYKSEVYGTSDNLYQNLKDLDTTGLTTKQKVIIGSLLTGGTVGTGVYAYNKYIKKPVPVKPKPVVKPGFFTRLTAPSKPKPVVKPVSKPGFFSNIFYPKPAPKKTFKDIFVKKTPPPKFLGIF